MKQVVGLLMALVMTAFVANVYADPARIGVVDLQKIMQTSTQMRAIQQKLETEFKPRRDKLMAQESNLKKEIEQFKRDSSVLSQTQKKDLEKKIVAARRAFERDGQQYQQELSTAHNEAMEELYGKIRKAISEVAQNEKYDLVLQKDAAPFSIEKFDITKAVMDKLS